MSGPTLLLDDRPRARKHHRCFDCGGWIVPGETHRKSSHVRDGSAYSLRQHLDCLAMSEEVVADGYAPDYWYDGIPPLREDEGVLESLNAWRGRYPHVVTRIEFHEQISDLRWQDHLQAVAQANNDKTEGS